MHYQSHQLSNPQKHSSPTITSEKENNLLNISRCKKIKLNKFREKSDKNYAQANKTQHKTAWKERKLSLTWKSMK